MSIKMKVEGFRDIEKALAALPAGTAKGVARRAMKKELKPVKDMADSLWPGASAAFKISSRTNRGQRPMFRPSRTTTNMNVGSFEPHAHLIEFGTGPRYTKAGAFRGSVAPEPMLQTAWAAHKHKVLKGLGARLWDEISKTVARRAKAAAKKART